MKKFYKSLVNVDKKDFNKIKSRLSKKLNLKKIPSNAEIFLNTNIKSIITKPTRTISGVAPLAIMTKPINCPSKAKCIYCPGGINSVFGSTPKSYTGHEPASRRALRNNYDPYLQVFNRLEQYSILNHPLDKIELIIMGGTFPSFNINYQDYFVKYALKAMNDFSDMFYKNNLSMKKFKKFFYLPGNINDSLRAEKIKSSLLKIKGFTNLKKEQLRNENSKIRCVALCIETRPDFCNVNHINQMLKLGCTRVELGVQTIYNNILKKINRGHTINDTIKATQLLKDSFLKVGYHIMPSLPYSTKQLDIKIFKELFSNQNFKPDALKIYPCLVIKGTKLYNLYLNKKYSPLSLEDTANLIINIKKSIPSYCRVLRVQRDIPSNLVVNKSITNLRQYVDNLMIKKNIKCQCIRCRKPKQQKIDFDNIKLKRFDYESSNGQEIFLSYEDVKNDLLLAFTRLRIPYKPFRKEITSNSAGIRELHVYGPLTQIGKSGLIQHQGLGKSLLKEAEKISREEFDIKKLLVISGIGVKNYYKNLGYKKTAFI